MGDAWDKADRALFPGREVRIVNNTRFNGSTGTIVERKHPGLFSVAIKERGGERFLFAHSDLEAIPAAQERADMVKHPQHYKLDLRGVEHDVWEVIEAVVEDMDGVPAYHVGSVLKYVLRSNKKGKMLEDLKKARQHLEKLIEGLS